MPLGGDHADDLGALGHAPPRPGIVGYIVALGLALGGCAAGAVWGWLGVSRAAERFRSFDAPGSATVTLDEAGSWTLYAESQGAKPNRSGFDACVVAVTAPDGTAATVSAMGVTTETYDVGSRHGVAIRRVAIPAPGSYTVAVDWPAGQPGPPFRAAMHRGLMGGVLGGVFGACGIVALSLLLAVVVAVVTFVRRMRGPEPVR